jgi:hypothetical protein
MMASSFTIEEKSITTNVFDAFSRRSIFYQLFQPFYIRVGSAATIPKEKRRKALGKISDIAESADILEETKGIVFDFTPYSSITIIPYKTTFVCSSKEEFAQASEDAIKGFTDRIISKIDGDFESVLRQSSKVLHTKKNIGYNQIDHAAAKIEKKTGNVASFHVIANPAKEHSLRLLNLHTTPVVPENSVYVIGIPNCSGAYCPIGYSIFRKSVPVISILQNIEKQSYDFICHLYFAPIVTYPECIIRIEESEVTPPASA